jgi:hypothetical protein
MKRRNFALPWVLILVTAAGFSAAAEPETLVLSASSTADIGGLRIADEQPVTLRLIGSEWNLGADLSSLLPGAVDVDALSMTTGGDLVLSTDVGFLHDGLPVADEDLLLFEDGTLTVLFDGSANGLPGAADIDAVHIVGLSPLEFFYSTTTPTEIDGFTYQDDDVVHWAAGSHSLAVSGSDLFGSKRDRLDVDGLWVDPVSGDLLLSTDVGVFDIDSVTEAGDDDVLRYDSTTGTLSLFADMSDHGVDSSRVDFDALSAPVTLPFADGFESGDLGNWSTAVP